MATNTSDDGGQVNYNSKTDVQVLNQDINFIHSEWNGPCLPRNRWDNRGQLAGGLLAIGPWLWGFHLLPGVGVEEDEKNPLNVRKRRAKSAVRQELRKPRGT